MEKALKEGKTKYIGVSNYPAELLYEMKEYAEIMPAVNELEFHPRFAAPSVLEAAKDIGLALIGYGTGCSFTIEKNKVVAEIAAKYGRHPLSIVCKWTNLKGVCLIPRSDKPNHIGDNLLSTDFDLAPEDVARLDSLNEDYPYYWDPKPTAITAVTNKKPLKLVVRLEIDENRVDEFLEAIKIDCIGSRNEPGCTQFEVLRDHDSANTFTLLEGYINEDAFA
jgi:diketogulonate reductase-like aldo/keto reductase